jgi:predicted molibdopterin-dependent oxidoreductase YjgC
MKENPGFTRLENVQRGIPLEIEVDGRPVPAFAGESVAAALLAAGIFFCQSHDGRPLGVFCNIGQCCSCLMTVDGMSGVRACQTPASPGLKVVTRRVEKRADRP